MRWNLNKKVFFLPGRRHLSSGYTRRPLTRAQKYPLPPSCRGQCQSSARRSLCRLLDEVSRPALMWTADAWLWERGHLLPSSRPSQLRAQLPAALDPPRACAMFLDIHHLRAGVTFISLRSSDVHLKNSLKTIRFCWFGKDYVCIRYKETVRLQIMMQAFAIPWTPTLSCISC